MIPLPSHKEFDVTEKEVIETAEAPDVETQVVLAVDPAELTVAELEEALADIEDLELLELMLAAEQEGEERQGALAALNARIAEVDESMAVATEVIEELEAVLREELVPVLREEIHAEYTEKILADLRDTLIPQVVSDHEDEMLPLENIGDLRFFIEGSGTIFYLDEKRPGDFILRPFHNPGA